MEIGGAIVSGLRGFFGALIPPIKKKYFDQPKVYLVFNFNNASQRPQGLSSKNDSLQAIAVPHVIYDYELRWEYDLLLRNNSEHTAYNIKLISPTISNKFFLHPKLDTLKPLTENSEVPYSARFSDYFTGNGSEVAVRMKEGSHLLSEFILEYTNLKGTKFYTQYNHNAEEGKRHSFKSANPKRQIAILASLTIVILSLLFLVSWTVFYNGKKEKDEKATLKQDAHSVAASIVISGWEETGDYVGYLSQITGFYSRHKELFPTEYEIYKKQLDDWTNYLNNHRGKTLYSNDTEGLKGLVTSGKSQLEQLEK